MLVTTSNPTARISLKKNLLKVYKVGSEDVVYLPKDAEFEIELFNPTTEEIAAEILLNNKTISTSKLVIRPGERVFLERYLDSSEKFKFDTYMVEDTKEVASATRYNGLVQVRFYKKFEYYRTSYTVFSNPTWATCISSPSNDILYTSNANTISYSAGVTSGAPTVKCFNATADATPAIETGIIGKGETSDQSFGKSYDDFNFIWTWQTTVKILPNSAKPLTTEDLKVRQYCSECGSKVKATDKFCSNCGTKL